MRGLVARVVVGCGALALWLGSVGGAAASGWAVQSTPNPAGATRSQFVGVSCTSAKSCIAVGYFGNGGRALMPLAERWDGALWSLQRMAKPAGALLTVFSAVSCSSRTACTAVGYFTGRPGVAVTLAERWDGARWSVERTPSPRDAEYSYLASVSCPSVRSCTAVGTSRSLAGDELMLAERWNGRSWSIQQVPSPLDTTAANLEGVSCPSSNACTAVGTFLGGAAVYAPLAEHWNGTSWRVQPSAAPALTTYSQLVGVSCASFASCTAVGFLQTGAGPLLTLAERWDGRGWTIQRTPNPNRARTSQLFGVACPSGLACSAIGNFANGGGAFVALAERGEHARWVRQRTARPAGATNSGLDGVSCPSRRTCTAVGYFIDRAGTVLTLAERLT